MLYDRKIKYLDYYEGGNKVNGGGFAKLEVRDNTLRIELTIKGLHPTDSFERDIVLQGAGKEGTLGQIRIQNGCGQFRYSCDVGQKIGATGISYSELRGIRISIGGTREILCQWDNVSDKRRIIPPEENTQKSKSGLQGPKRESIDEGYIDKEEDSEASAYTENEQTRELKLEKTEKVEEKRREAKKEGYESIEEKNKKEKNREDKDREGQEGGNRKDKDREGQEDKNRKDKDREGQEEENREDKDREEQEDKKRKDKDREGQEEQNKEDKDRETQEGENREDKDRERQEDKNREGKNREGQEEQNREEKDRKRKEGKENNDKKENEEGKDGAKKGVEKKESTGRGDEGLEIRGEDIKNDVKSGPTEIQAQGATIFSDEISSQVPKETSQTAFQSEEQSGDRAEGKPNMAENKGSEQPDVKKAPVKLMDDKWQQLSAIYPHIQPFHDERDYLSLTPSDFVLFPNRFYRAVNNSFLLHGYYNYNHLILARIERRGEILYYIGVPGNYFEREKQVAIMFGFESFECETEPAKTGDFGYYMMRTEL